MNVPCERWPVSPVRATRAFRPISPHNRSSPDGMTLDAAHYSVCDCLCLHNNLLPSRGVRPKGMAAAPYPRAKCSLSSNPARVRLASRLIMLRLC